MPKPIPGAPQGIGNSESLEQAISRLAARSEQRQPKGPEYSAFAFEWLSVGGLDVHFELRVDNISAIMLAMVTGVSLLVALFGRRPCEAWIMLWNVRLRPPEMAWTRVSPSVTPTAVASGGFLGTLSHVMIDSIMHVDVHPWKPLLPGNSMQGLVSIDVLHLWCIGAGLIGGALLYIARIKARISPPH